MLFSAVSNARRIRLLRTELRFRTCATYTGNIWTAILKRFFKTEAIENWLDRLSVKFLRETKVLLSKVSHGKVNRKRWCASRCDSPTTYEDPSSYHCFSVSISVALLHYSQVERNYPYWPIATDPFVPYQSLYLNPYVLTEKRKIKIPWYKLPCCRCSRNI